MDDTLTSPSEIDARGATPARPAPRETAGASGAAPTRPRHFSMLRTFVLADLLTMANAACGMTSVFLCLSYLDARQTSLLWIAMGLLPLALVFDALDGSVARWRAKHSPLGADLDSLADIISFGVAPATLGFTLGMRGGWDAVILIAFVVCGIARLARYNVTAVELAAGKGKVPYYEGTPIPTTLAIVAALAVALGMGDVHEALWLGSTRAIWVLHPLSLLYLLSGAAMISATLRIPKP